jgi:hypothetical protein
LGDKQQPSTGKKKEERKKTMGQQQSIEEVCFNMR